MSQLIAPFRSEYSSFPKNHFPRLPTSLRRIFHPNTPLGGAGVHHYRSMPPPLGVERSLPIDPDALREHLLDLVSHLPPLLPDSCKWLEQGDLEFFGEQPIDAGGIADVWVGMMGDRKIAIKSYRYCSSSDYLPIYVRFYKEALACSRLEGPNVVPFIGIYSSPEHPSALIFEFMEQLNLREYLRNNRGVRRLELLLAIARGVERIHKLNIVHGSLKITNILVDPNGHARIAGLGVALISSPMPGVDIDRFFHGAAPELVSPQRPSSSNTGATKPSDVYAFAILSLEIFAGQAPFSDESHVAGVFSMLMGRRPPRPDHPELSDRLWETIKGCWKVDPGQRKTITRVVAVLEAEVAARQPRSCTLGPNWT